MGGESVGGGRIGGSKLVIEGDGEETEFPLKSPIFRLLYFTLLLAQ